jgi:hypothetical protein
MRVTTAAANELARESLLKIIVARLQACGRRRFGGSLSLNNIWREVHRRSV